MSKVSPEDIIIIIKELDFKTDTNNLLCDKDLLLQNIDSLDLMRLLFAIEEKYNITINDESINEKEWSSIDKIAHQLNCILANI